MIPFPKKEDYILLVRRPYPPLLLTLVNQGFAGPEFYEGLYEDPSLVSIKCFLNIHGDIYYKDSELKYEGNLAFNQLINPDRFLIIKKEIVRREQALLNTENSNFSEFAQKSKEFCPAVNIFLSPDSCGLFERELKNSLDKKVSNVELEELLNLLNTPFENNYFKQEEYDLVITNNLEEHVKKYEWFNARYGSRNKYTIEEAKLKKEAIKTDEYLEKYKNEKEKIENAIKHAKDVLGSNSHIVDVVQFATYYRTQRSDVFNRVAFNYIPKLDELAKELNISYEQLLQCTPEEILEKQIPDKRILDRRIKSNIVYMYDGKTANILIDEDEKRVVEEFEHNLSNIIDLDGMVACSGFVLGPVKIIKGVEDFAKIKKGDILVTSMTTPNMIPIMKKSGGIVTNEGGITCHAAVISRELKKPCVIGTKIATKVLKDGDMVELNANKGIVKLINK